MPLRTGPTRPSCSPGPDTRLSARWNATHARARRPWPATWPSTIPPGAGAERAPYGLPPASTRPAACRTGPAQRPAGRVSAVSEEPVEPVELRAVGRTQLEPVVRQALRCSTARVCDWEWQTLSYQSFLPGPLRAPRVLGIDEDEAGAVWLWLEEVSDLYAHRWPIEQYGLAARHLGAFNGAYL